MSSQFSISKSLRTTPKVNAGLANNAYSERFLDAGCLGVCPTRFPVDNLQRCADPRSLVTLTAGCDSASERIDIETAVERPYYTYLPLAADGINQAYTPGGGYDTLGVYREQAFGYTGQGVLPGCACNHGKFDAYQDRQRYNSSMRRVYDKTRWANDCQY
jgi:hypothetical protein